MDKKYELLKDDYINYRGKTLYRIKALRDFGYIKKGKLGGYIQNENNLSHEGECWIYSNAKVFDSAKVFGYAKVFESVEVYGNAKVYGNAEVYGDAKVYGIARVFGDAEVYGDARVYGNAKIYGSAFVCGNANVYEDAQVCGDSYICGNAIVYGNVVINKGTIIGKVSIPYKDLFQHQCEYRMLTAILTENDEILYSIGCQKNITEKEFIDRIYNKGGGLEKNPHRYEYLKLIKTINFHFKEKLNN